MTTFHAALEHLLGKLPAFEDAAATALGKLANEVHVPDVISIYAASYCRDKRVDGGSRSAECFFRRASTLDISLGLRVLLLVLYTSAVLSSILGLAALLSATRRHSDPQRWHVTIVWTWLAFGFVMFASVIVTVVVYAVCMIVAENVPPAVVAIQIGGRFLALTWTASFCFVLSLAALQAAYQRSG